MLQLARFMETVLTKVPDLNSTDSAIQKELETGDEDVIVLKRANSSQTSILSSPGNTIQIPRKTSAERIQVSRSNSSNVISVNRSNSANSPISASRSNSLSKISVASLMEPIKKSKKELSEEECQNFDIPSGYITSEVVDQIITVYKREGKLSTNSVHKLLRLSYRAMKTLPNTTVVTVKPGEKLTVVGDIHGEDSFVFCAKRTVVAA